MNAVCVGGENFDKGKNRSGEKRKFQDITNGYCLKSPKKGYETSPMVRGKRKRLEDSSKPQNRGRKINARCSYNN